MRRDISRRRLRRLKSAGVPGLDSRLWGQDKFTSVRIPVDWCTVRQAQEHANRNVKPDSLLEDIAKGRIVSSVYSQKEAQNLLDAQKKRSSRERRG